MFPYWVIIVGENCSQNFMHYYEHSSDGHYGGARPLTALVLFDWCWFKYDFPPLPFKYGDSESTGRFWKFLYSLRFGRAVGQWVHPKPEHASIGFYFSDLNPIDGQIPDGGSYEILKLAGIYLSPLFVPRLLISTYDWLVFNLSLKFLHMHIGVLRCVHCANSHHTSIFPRSKKHDSFIKPFSWVD